MRFGGLRWGCACLKEPVWRNPPDLTEPEGMARMGYFQNIYNLSTEDYGPKRDA